MWRDNGFLRAKYIQQKELSQSAKQAKEALDAAEASLEEFNNECTSVTCADALRIVGDSLAEVDRLRRMVLAQIRLHPIWRRLIWPNPTSSPSKWRFDFSERRRQA